MLGDCLNSTEDMDIFVDPVGFRLCVRISLLCVVVSMLVFVFKAFAWLSDLLKCMLLSVCGLVVISPPSVV